MAPIEVLLTVDEEAGTTGAFGLKARLVRRYILLNTDSEQEGEVYISAGGIDGAMTFFEIARNADSSRFQHV